jgi:DNA-binding MarR family transcriptional regulator
MAASRPQLSDARYRALAEFRHALRVFLAFSEQAARDVGLTPAQHQLLLAVRGWPQAGPPAIGDLAEFLQSKPHSTLELARRAEQVELVKLVVDPEDRRRQLVVLTEPGAEKLEAHSQLHQGELVRFHRQMDQLLGDLDGSPAPMPEVGR